MYSAVVRKPFEVQEKCRQEAAPLEITCIFSIPRENARFQNILGAENDFRIVKYSTHPDFGTLRTTLVF